MPSFLPIIVPGSDIETLPRTGFEPYTVFEIDLHGRYTNGYYIVTPIAYCGSEIAHDFAATAERNHQEYCNSQNMLNNMKKYGWTNSSGILQLTTETNDDIFKYYLSEEGRKRWEEDHKKS